MKPSLVLASVALLLSGCAATYQLTLMPRDSGTLYQGTAEDTGGPEGTMTVTIGDRTYSGTWVEVVPDRAAGYVSGAWGPRRRGFGLGATFLVDTPGGGEVKALLRSADGAGLRCDLRGGAGRAGGGVCRDDKGLDYDVQIRPAGRK